VPLSPAVPLPPAAPLAPATPGPDRTRPQPGR